MKVDDTTLHNDNNNKSPNMAQLKPKIYFTGRLFFLSYKVDTQVNQKGLKLAIGIRKQTTISLASAYVKSSFSGI